MLKCEERMQQDFLNATKNKVYKLNHYDEMKRIVAFSFIKNLNNTLKEENTIIGHVRHDYVLLYTVYAQREFEKIKLVDFVVSINLDEESDVYSVSDCLVTAWLTNREA